MGYAIPMADTTPLSPIAQAIVIAAEEDPKVADWLNREPKDAGIFSETWMAWFNEAL